MDIEKLNERLKEKLTIEEYQQLSALMFGTLDKYFWNKGIREMATCNDCIHYDVCKALEDQVGMIDARQCGCYKDESRYIELPCKVGGGYGVFIL